MKEASTIRDLTSDTITEGMRVQAEAFFLKSGEKGVGDLNTFSYKITFTNEGNEPAQLISRQWTIINSHGVKEEIRGPGVVGENPRLESGQSYSYNSYSQINTNWGTMEGSYLFKRDNGDTFDAGIGRFYLVKNDD